jgi:hypothetical protein
MPTPRLLADNDALLKAAHWDFLEDVPGVAGCDWPEVACVPQFPPRVRRADPKLFTLPDVAAALEACVTKMAAMPEPDAGVLAALQAQPGIDAGELVLIGALVASPQALWLTGDKRALAALARTEVAGACAHRVVCVEQLVWRALDRLGPKGLVAHIRRWSGRDQTLLAIAGRDGERTEAHLREGLQSYIRWLDGEAPGLLVREYGLAPT